jgi:hypothetical protein
MKEQLNKRVRVIKGGTGTKTEISFSVKSFSMLWKKIAEKDTT